MDLGAEPASLVDLHCLLWSGRRRSWLDGLDHGRDQLAVDEGAVQVRPMRTDLDGVDLPGLTCTSTKFEAANLAVRVEPSASLTLIAMSS